MQITTVEYVRSNCHLIWLCVMVWWVWNKLVK